MLDPSNVKAMEKPTANPLSTKAVLAHLKIKRWTGRKLDRAVTDEVNKSYDAEADASRVNKLIIPKAAFAEINAIVGSARRRHHTITQPWVLDGAGILPSVLVEQFSKEFRKFKDDFNQAADGFERTYPNYLGSAAGKRMRKMFKQEDYPEPDQVRGLFGFKHWIAPMTTDDFRVKLAKEQLEDAKAEVAAMLKESLDNAMKEPVRRILKVVGKMSFKLHTYGEEDEEGATQTFRDSLVNNIRDMMEILPAFNLSGDKALAQLIKDVEIKLCKHDGETLREDDTLREAVASEADKILERANALMA